MEGINIVGFMDPPINARRHDGDHVSELKSERSGKHKGSCSYRKLTKDIKRESEDIDNRAIEWERKT